MRILLGHDGDVCDFVAGIIWGRGVRFQDRHAKGFGYLDAGGVLRAGFVIHNWDPRNRTVEVSAASLHRSMQTLRHLRVIPQTAFDLIPDLRVLVARTAEDNRTVRRVMRSFGAQETVIPGLRLDQDGREIDEIVCTLRRADFAAVVAKAVAV